ncbi:MAG TPA: serine/threonine protein kinase, partial [Myxococcaceae bacterium]
QGQVNQRTIILNDGPIESILEDQLGSSVLETGTRVYGKVWTSGPNVVIRYYEAHPLDPGETLAICAVARLDEGELKKKPGPAPGSAVLEYSTARLVVVDAFR